MKGRRDETKDETVALHGNVVRLQREVRRRITTVILNANDKQL